MNHFLDTAYVFGGDPTTAGGMDYLGDVRGQITINPQMEVATGRTDRHGRNPIADGIYSTGAMPVASVPFVDEAKAKLENHFVGVEKVDDGNGNEAILFPTGTRKVDPADIMTVCFLPKRPVGDYPADLADDEDCFWLPAGIPQGDPQFTFELPEGDDIFNPHEVQFMGATRLTDQGDTALEDGQRALFYGGATAAGLPGWTAGLPAPADLEDALSA